MPLELRRIAANACCALALTGALSSNVQAADAAAGALAVAEHAAKTRSLTIRLPKDETVAFRGIPNFDHAGAGAFNMLYPAPHPAGLLVAVLTHAVIAESAQSRQRRELQDAADRVLGPYAPVLAEITHKDLIARAVRHAKASDVQILEGGASSDAALVLTPELVVYMTPDQRALVLDAAFHPAVRDGKEVESPAHVVRVVGAPQQFTDAFAFWNNDRGEKLKHESALLFAHALDLARGAVIGATDPPGSREMTVRYSEGGVEKMERGKLLSESCGRGVIRTLRGGLMSVPLRASHAASGACDRSP